MAHGLTHRFASLYVRGLNKLVRTFLGGDRRPVFVDAEKELPALKTIDDNFDVIREELMTVLPNRDDIPRYHEFDDEQDYISTKHEGDWRVFYVHMYRAGDRIPGKQLCPRTAAVIEKIPNVMEAFFSILDPRKVVPKHEGPYVGKLRYHTAFVVPKVNPPSITVKDRTHTWKERTSFLFDDSYPHEVENECDEVRVVLVVDTLRRLPWPLHLLNLVGRRLAFADGLLEPALAKLQTLSKKS